MTQIPKENRHIFKEKIMEASFIEGLKQENLDILFNKDNIKNDPEMKQIKKRNK